MIATSHTPTSLHEALEAETDETRRMLVRNRLVLLNGEAVPEAWPGRIVITTPNQERARHLADRLTYEGYTSSIVFGRDDYRIEGRRL